MRSVTSVVS